MMILKISKKSEMNIFMKFEMLKNRAEPNFLKTQLAKKFF